MSKLAMAIEYLDKQIKLLARGERLSSIEKMAKDAGVSLTTMHKAVGNLVKRGKLKAVPGKGVFICVAESPEPHKFPDIFFSDISPIRKTGLSFFVNEPVPWKLKCWNSICLEFSKLYPWIEIDIIERGNPAETDSDIILGNQELILELVNKNKLLDCTHYLNWQKLCGSIVPNIMEPMTFNGGKWGVPVFLNIIVSIFSNPALQKTGVCDLQNISSMKEYIKLIIRASKILKSPDKIWKYPAATNHGYTRTSHGF